MFLSPTSVVMRPGCRQHFMVGNVQYAPGVPGPVWSPPPRYGYSLSPAGRPTGKRNIKRVEEALPEGALSHYNPSKWNQSGTMHPTVASKSSPVSR